MLQHTASSLAFLMSVTVVLILTSSLQLTKHCRNLLSLKALASLRNLLTFEFIEELEAMARKIECKEEDASCNFTSARMCSKYFEELV